MKIKNKKNYKNSSKTLFIENQIGSKVGLLSSKSNFISKDEIYLSPENAAQYLDVSRKFIYELIQSKKIEVVCLGRKLKRIKKRTLDEWLVFQAMKHER